MISVCSRTWARSRARRGSSGRRLAGSGVRRALCLNQETDNEGVNARCRGLAKALREAGGEATTFAIDDESPRTPALIAQAVEATGADGVLATNSIGGLAAADARRARR